MSVNDFDLLDPIFRPDMPTPRDSECHMGGGWGQSMTLPSMVNIKR